MNTKNEGINIFNQIVGRDAEEKARREKVEKERKVKAAAEPELKEKKKKTVPKEKKRELTKRLNTVVSYEAYYALKDAAVERSKKENRFVSMNEIVDDLLIQLQSKGKKKRNAEEAPLPEEEIEKEEELISDLDDGMEDDTIIFVE